MPRNKDRVEAKDIWASSVDDLVSVVADGDRIAVSGFHFVRGPMAQLAALRERGLTGLTWVAWGGGLPLEYLLSESELIHRIEFCFSSFDIFGLAPRFRSAIENETVSTFEMTALGYVVGLQASLSQLPYGVMQTPVETELRNGFTVDAPDPWGSDVPVSAVRSLGIDVLLLHATRADEYGNVEIAGALGSDEIQAMAARTVLVTVEEMVPAGTLGRAGERIISREFVDRVALAPFGAYPTSSLPYYPADYERLRDIAEIPVTEEIGRDLLIPSDERRNALSAVARADVETLESAIRSVARGKDHSGPWTIAELMAVEMSRSIDNGSLCSIGSVSPLATVAYYLAKRLQAPGCIILSSNGGYLDVTAHPLSLTTTEALDFATCVRFTSSDETYQWLYQQGRVSHEVVSSAQVDKTGATNSLVVYRSDGSPIRLPGQGGMADVADMHRNFSIYLARHSKRALVEAVDVVGARRHHYGRRRRELGYRQGRVEVLTNLCRFELDEASGELVVTHLHPGVSREDVIEATGFEVRFSDNLATSEPPTEDELRVIRTEIDPLGLCRLEFVAAAERSAVIEELLVDEAEIVERIVASSAAEEDSGDDR